MKAKKLSRADAAIIVNTYDAYVRVNGRVWADKHYLAKGTNRGKRAKALLQRALNILK